jgi:hypothetical protein
MINGNFLLIIFDQVKDVTLTPMMVGCITFLVTECGVLTYTCIDEGTAIMQAKMAGIERNPFKIQIIEYYNGTGPLFGNEESRNLAMNLVKGTAISVTAGVVAGSLSYGLT